MQRTTRNTPRHSPSSRALAKLIEHPAWVERFERAGIHKTMVWRYASGRGKPSVQLAGVIHEVTRGRVSAATWRSDQPGSSCVGERVYS
jgi:hypothetical protein